MVSKMSEIDLSCGWMGISAVIVLPIVCAYQVHKVFSTACEMESQSIVDNIDLLPLEFIH